MKRDRLAGAVDAADTLLMHHVDSRPMNPAMAVIHVPHRGWAVALILDGFYTDQQGAADVQPAWAQHLKRAVAAIERANTEMEASA